MSKKVLITGGEGFIGSYLTKRFQQDGWYVVTLDNGFGTEWEIYHQVDPSQIARIRASATNLDAVLRAMQGVDLVYHLAARSDVSSSVKHPLRMTSANVMSTAVVLSAAVETGVPKVIFTSSADVYGNLVPAKETDQCVPITLYGATKLAAENICRAFFNRGLEIAVLRLFNVWGSKQSHSVVDKFKYPGPTPFISGGDGSQSRDFVHIDDVVEALVKAIDWDPNIYNIGTGVETTIMWLFNKFCPKLKPNYVGAFQDTNPVYRICADMDFTFSQTSWRPKISLNDEVK